MSIYIGLWDEREDGEEDCGKNFAVDGRFGDFDVLVFRNDGLRFIIGTRGDKKGEKNWDKKGTHVSDSQSRVRMTVHRVFL